MWEVSAAARRVRRARAALVAALGLAFAAAPAAAGPAGVQGLQPEWQAILDASLARSLAEAELAPSPLALRIAIAEFPDGLAAMDPAAAATRIVALAVQAERDLCFGMSAQEVRSMVRLRLAFGDSGHAGGMFLKEMRFRLSPASPGNGAGNPASPGNGVNAGRGRR